MSAQNPNDWLIGPRPSTWWTGRPPGDGLIHSMPQLQFRKITRRDVLNYFDNTWALTEVLFSGLQGEAAFTTPPSHQLRHPLIFYYGHPAVLYVNKLRVAGLLKEPVNSRLENILEVGVDEMSWDDMSKNEMSWPPVREITEYRRQVYALVKNLILEHPQLDPQTNAFGPGTAAWSLVMGFEHERIHLETSSVLMRELPLNFLRKPEQWPAPQLSQSAPHAPAGFVALEKGSVRIGKPTDAPSFGWDNEYGEREVQVAPFEAGRTLVTNAEFLEFVKDGGYRESRYWSAEGWGWRGFRNTKAPAFWISEGPAGMHQYRLRTIFEVVPFQPDWPAVVNFHEARAYCNWKTAKEKSKHPFRLITEAEHHRLRQLADPKWPWNLNLRHGSETSVFGSAPISDVFGNVWQWCEDEFNPLPGFTTHPYYEDFSLPCFDGKHQMIMGGSFISTGDEAEPFARFHFRPHFFQHAGFRVARGFGAWARDTAVRLSTRNSADASDYESGELLSQYLLLHFAEPKDVLPFAQGPFEALSFPGRCAELLAETARSLNIPLGTALDIGCAVGGASFHLSGHFDQVTGLDLSSSFIATAQRMQSQGVLDFDYKNQGELMNRLTVRRPAGSRPERIHFLEGDACALPSELRDFDAVMMVNLLCRLPNPRACLQAMAGTPGVVKPGGLLMLVSPYSWMESHTPRDAWIGGRFKDGLPVSSEDELRRFLSPQFELLREGEIPLLIREHARKYQYIVPHMMLWRRKTK